MFLRVNSFGYLRLRKVSMQICEYDISEIRPYAMNPRNNALAVAGVAESIRRFGFMQPIVIGPDKTIVCGHTRYLAAKKLKLGSVPCVRADDLTEDERKAYRLLDNKLHESSKWDDDLLSKELDGFEFDFKPFRVNFSFDQETSFFDEDEDDYDESAPRSFQLVVDCEDEETQDDLYERLTQEGFRVRVCGV